MLASCVPVGGVATGNQMDLKGSSASKERPKDVELHLILRGSNTTFDLSQKVEE